MATHALSTRLADNKVLLVDGSQELSSAQSALTQAGCKVYVAADGFEALSEVVQQGPDIVIAATSLPRLNGFQVCALIKRRRRFAGTRVVLWAANDGVFERARARIAGSDALLAGPWSPERLLEALGALLEPRREGQTLV